ncbi:MAG: hypothetical protein WEA04_03850 [Candidatus Andersenbacteria bacterium]
MLETLQKISKKEQIAALYLLGITAIEELATLTRASPSYIANVLREANLLGGYFDLYTSSDRPMNVYSKFFAGKLGFKNKAAAHHSVHYIDTLYHQFGRIGDPAGQHHTLVMALTMRNRALWSNKLAEAEVFAAWLRAHLKPVGSSTSPATALMEDHLARQGSHSKSRSRRPRSSSRPRQSEKAAVSNPPRSRS